MAIVRKLLALLGELSNPATDASIVALLVQLVPGVHFNGVALAGILGGVGIVAAFVRKQFTALQAKRSS